MGFHSFMLGHFVHVALVAAYVLVFVGADTWSDVRQIDVRALNLGQIEKVEAEVLAALGKSPDSAVAESDPPAWPPKDDVIESLVSRISENAKASKLIADAGMKPKDFVLALLAIVDRALIAALTNTERPSGNDATTSFLLGHWDTVGRIVSMCEVLLIP
jgi:hypothetical protein